MFVVADLVSLSSGVIHSINLLVRCEDTLDKLENLHACELNNVRALTATESSQ